MKIYGFVGLIGSGKDTASRYLVARHEFVPFAFADSLKDTVAALFCWPRDLLEGETGASRSWRNEIDPWWAAKLGIPHFTPRWALQNIGTETIRRHFNPDIWLMNTERRIEATGSTRVVITDARFANEIEFVRKLGGEIVRVARGPDPKWFEIAEAANASPHETIRAANRQVMLTEYAHVHESEWAWAGTDFDHRIDNDGSLDDLHRATEALLS